MQTFDFNALNQPTWPVKLGGGTPDEIVVNLAYPTTELVERLMALSTNMGDIAASKDGRMIRGAFEVIAEVLSCNMDGYTFTAEELRDKYKMSFYALTVFQAQYYEFIAQANNAKN